MRSSNASKPWRCNYCQQPAVVWGRYQGYISRDIRPTTGGHMTLYIAACAEHEGCTNWVSMLQHHPETVIERKA